LIKLIKFLKKKMYTPLKNNSKTPLLVCRFNDSIKKGSLPQR
jgi:hypothetical protein